MRKTNLTEDEILAAEQAADDRRQSRNRGFAGMKERDQGSVCLSNGVYMEWPVIKPVFPDKGGPYVYPREVPEGTILLDGKSYDTEELRRWLRWA